MTSEQNVEFVSVVIPAYNEEKYLNACVTSLAVQLPPSKGELIIIDGGSSDSTLSVAQDLARRFANVRVLHNPKRIQAAGVNLAFRVADPRSAIIIRADAHNEYSEHHIQTCIATLQKTGATSVVYPVVSVGRSIVQRAIARTMMSRLGNGGAVQRGRVVRSGYVDHGHHGAFNRAFFMKVGGYNEGLSHNEDVEYDRRALLAGGKSWLCSEAAVHYYPRSRLRDLAAQYYKYGRGRAVTLLNFPGAVRWRHLLCVGLLLGNLLSVVLGLLLAPIFLTFVVAYAVFCCAWGISEAIKDRDLSALLMGPAAMTMHMCWGLGFLAELPRGGKTSALRAKDATEELRQSM